MTKRERFEKFLANEPVDRVPVAFFHHFTTEQEWLTGLTDEAAFEKNIEGHRIARAKFDPDVIKIMNDTLMIMPVDTSFVKTAADLRKIQPPMPGSAFFEKSKELTKRVVAIYEGSDAPIYITAFSPCWTSRSAATVRSPGWAWRATGAPALAAPCWRCGATTCVPVPWPAPPPARMPG